MAPLQDQSNKKRNIQTLRNLYINSNLKYTLYVSNHQIWNAFSFIWGKEGLKIEEKVIPRNSKRVVRNTYMKNRGPNSGKIGDIIYGWPLNRVV